MPKNETGICELPTGVQPPLRWESRRLRLGVKRGLRNATIHRLNTECQISNIKYQIIDVDVDSSLLQTTEFLVRHSIFLVVAKAFELRSCQKRNRNLRTADWCPAAAAVGKPAPAAGR